MKSSYIKNLRQYRKFGYYLYSHRDFKKKGGVLRNRYMCKLGIPDCYVCTMYFYVMSPALYSLL